MDVVNAGAYFGAEVGGLERVQNLKVGAAGFKGDYVGVHVVDVLDDVVEFRVAHVRVDLRVGLNA